MSATTAAAVVVPIVLGILGLLGTVWVARIQRKARENEERLRGYEAYDHTYANLRADYDRVTRENNDIRTDLNRVRRERDDAVRQVALRDRQIETWLTDKEERRGEG